eukprot:TRINITY_DN30524_c0_g1_i1.p1 TRINITY_DN30524_c0_g1~~TRINITY_DN30524_c0_g1_i1.p1  ORF type:complete len:488 (+),score=135.86 TRINITY_DN30524_c0_g1_i1:64-1464(+)
MKRCFADPWVEESLPPLPRGRWHVVTAAGLLIRRTVNTTSEERGRAAAGTVLCVVEVDGRRGRVAAAPHRPTGWVSLYASDGRQLAEPFDGQAAPDVYPTVLQRKATADVSERTRRQRATQRSVTLPTAPVIAPGPEQLLTPTARRPPLVPRDTEHYSPPPVGVVSPERDRSAPIQHPRQRWQAPSKGKSGSGRDGLFRVEKPLHYGDPYIAEPWVRAAMIGNKQAEYKSSVRYYDAAAAYFSPSPARRSTGSPPSAWRPGQAGSPACHRSGSPATWEEALTRFYMRHNAARVQGVPELLRRYQGREAVLWKLLLRRYGVTDPAISSLTPPVSTLVNKSHDAELMVTPGTQHMRTPDTMPLSPVDLGAPHFSLDAPYAAVPAHAPDPVVRRLEYSTDGSSVMAAASLLRARATPSPVGSPSAAARARHAGLWPPVAAEARPQSSPTQHVVSDSDTDVTESTCSADY